MEKMALEIPDPPGIEKIKSHEEKFQHSQESEVKFKMNDFYYISHGGPGSGRYPLGSGDRPYQKFEGSRRSGGISGYIRSRKEKKSEEKRQKAMTDARQRAEDNAKERERHIADKERVLRAGSATEVLKYKGELTNKELQDAYSRIEWERKLSSFSQSEMQSGMKKVDAMMQNLKTFNNWSSIGTDTWNFIASVYNATPEGKENPWPIVSKGGGKK